MSSLQPSSATQYLNAIAERGWRSICQAFALHVGISSTHLRVLDAFGAKDDLPLIHDVDAQSAISSASTESPALTEPSVSTNSEGTAEAVSSVSTASLEAVPPQAAEVFFAALEALVHEGQEALVTATVEILQREVDEAQAAMFGRRFDAVCSLLYHEASAADERSLDVVGPRQELAGRAGLVGLIKRLWRVGLLCRVDEILCAERPKALRIRAICDFYYSHAAVLFHLFQRKHRAPSQPTDGASAASCDGTLSSEPGGLLSLEEAVATAVWEPCGEGAHHALLVPLTDLGPIHVNVLKVSRPRLGMFDCRGAGGPQPITEIAKERGAWAATSGGFFLYTEKDILPPSRRTDPVGLFVRDGEVIWPPVLQRAALCQMTSGALHVGPIGMSGVTIAWAQPDAGQVQVTAIATLDAVAAGPVCWNRAHRRPDAHPYPGFSFVGREVVQVGMGLRDVPLAGGLVLLPPDAPLPGPGAALRFVLPSTPMGDIVEGIAGGPMLLSTRVPTLDLAAEDFAGDAPPVTFSQDETFDQNLLPRMAAGLQADGTLVMAAIDGRNFHLAPGFTLGHTARLMQALGCVCAMNLDGGSSKRMVIDGRVVDLPSTEVQASKLPQEQGTTATGGDSEEASSTKPRIRPVHTAILLL